MLQRGIVALVLSAAAVQAVEVKDQMFSVTDIAKIKGICRQAIGYPVATERVPARELGTEESLSFSFSGKTWNFYVLNIPSENIRAFQERVRGMPDLGSTPTPALQPTANIEPTPSAASGGWTFCANETERCNFSGTKKVRYGANDIYTYGTFDNGVVCSNTAFGSDPLLGVIKHCDYADIGTPTPTPTPRSR